MYYRLKVPARINILGNPSDAVEGDFATITMTINKYAYAEINPHSRIVLEKRSSNSQSNSYVNTTEEYSYSELPLPYGTDLDLCKAAINYLYTYSHEFKDKLDTLGGFHLSTWSEVPRQSGLGGSSLFVILTLAALREYYHLDKSLHNDYILAEITQRVESNELGITCGFADRYAPLFGGLLYIDYRGKLFHKPIKDEPLATIEPLSEYINRLSLIAVTTGLQHNSGDVHAPMRKKYLEEYEHWQQSGGTPPPMVKFMQGIWRSAWRGKIALLENDMSKFGSLMNENHTLVNEMMKYCGFTEGAGWANNLLIQTALENGALGAKLTGAGQGGSVYALVRPGNEQQVIQAWEKTINDNKLDKALIYTITPSKQGLEIQSIVNTSETA